MRDCAGVREEWQEGHRQADGQVQGEGDQEVDHQVGMKLKKTFISSPVRPDLAKLRHFGKALKSLAILNEFV